MTLRLKSGIAPVLLLFMPMLAVSAIASDAGSGKIAVQVDEHGRSVFVNTAGPAASVAVPTTNPPGEASRASVLVYWSNREQQWKSVPPPSRTAMRAARTAAAEASCELRVANCEAQEKAEWGRKFPIPRAPLPSDRQFTPHNARLTSDVDGAIERAAARHHVDPNLVRAVIKVESNFNPRAVSNKGAMGLMQLMPQTAQSLNVNHPFDPEENVDAGVRHLRTLLDDFSGDVKLSLAAYNAGEASVLRHGGIPEFPETQNYVRQITRLYAKQPSPAHRPSQTWVAPVEIFRGSNGVLTLSNE